ncbi:MAG TPA: diguanylate cyclase [Candidatus Sulfotelmatobacter sp.]|nr:diguanylate cyclase [Candidatus Sulfotelmatobacter sp.]
MLVICLCAAAGYIGFLNWRSRSEPEVPGSAGDGGSQFRSLAEAIPQIVWTADSQGQTNYINRRWYEMTGLEKGGGLGSSWEQFVHPDDLAICLQKWHDCVRSGETFEIEYRLRDRNDRYRWFINRAVPLRDDAGVIQQWFGSCTDIDDQMCHQQLLEGEIKARTGELFDANSKLQQQMWEKDLARKQLDEQNERMMSDLTERSKRATLLAKMGEVLQSCLNQEEVLKAAIGFAPKIFSSAGAMALFNPQQNLEVVSCWSNCRVPIPLFERSACWALRTGHTHFVPAGDDTARCAHAEGVTSSYVCIPIIAQGETLGILHFQAKEDHPQLTESDLSLKNTFAGQIGLSIANLRLREALRNQSIMDALTGLFNRRYLEEILEREVRRALRSDQSVGVMMLDLDHFKNFNDTYGHEAGDTVLREAASFLKRSVRAEDIVCRFGGEEFVVILPLADARVTQSRGDRIRSKLHELTILHQGKSLGSVTMSIGVAAVPDHGKSARALLEAADAALYRAKREGRDRVVVANPPEAEAQRAAIAEA